MHKKISIFHNKDHIYNIIAHREYDNSTVSKISLSINKKFRKNVIFEKYTTIIKM